MALAVASAACGGTTPASVPSSSDEPGVPTLAGSAVTPGGTLHVGYDGRVRSPDDGLVNPGFEGRVIVDGHPFEGRVTVNPAGRLASVELQAAAREPDLAPFRTYLAELRRLARVVCEMPMTPSPLGTPDPSSEEPWDPVIVTTTECRGHLFGLPVRYVEEESSASDFHNLRVTVFGP